MADTHREQNMRACSRLCGLADQLSSRPQFRRVVRVPIVVLALWAGWNVVSDCSLQMLRASVASTPAPDLPADPAFDRATLVMLAPAGPVLVDLQISVARLPYRQWVGQYLARQLDLNKSGTLDAAELQLLPPRLLAAMGLQNAAELTRELLPDDASGGVAHSQFGAWVRQRLPPSFAVSALPTAADDAVRLSTLIDLNRDASVSADELLVADQTLRFRDLDDDQTFSITELLPYRDPRSADASLAPDVASLPFFEVTDPASAARAAAALVARYGADQQLPVSRLRTPVQAAAAADSAGTAGSPAAPLPADSLSEAQLTEWLLAPVFHATLDVRLSDLANRSDLSLQVHPGADQFCQLSESQRGSVLLRIDGMRVRIVARGGGANNRAYVRGFLGQNFVMYDTDRNQYLDPEEFQSMSGVLRQSGAAGDFAAVDRNGDQMIVRDELFAFVEREQVTASSQIEVTVRQDGQTLFGLLDVNADRRLSLRELRTGFDVLQPWDVTGDGRLADEELGTEYQLTIGLGRTEIRRTNAEAMAAMQGQQAGATDAILPGRAELSGPEWFRRMDRNQDGDVSLREFPGPVATFAELDLNGDQLISSDEAQAVASGAAD